VTNLTCEADGSQGGVTFAIQGAVAPSPDTPRRIARAVVVSLALTAVAVPAVVALASWALPAPEDRYNARIVCGKNGTPSRQCHLRDLPRAQFVDHYDAKRPYRRCVARPDSTSYCDDLKTAPLADTPIADPLDIDQIGPWRVTWSVEGRRVGDWAFTVTW
jgi:hypothetical protein